MKFNSSEENLAENKALILYLLEKIHSDITNDGLFKIVSSINGINYFIFQQFLIDLVDSKLVESFSKEKETIFKITQERQKCIISYKKYNTGDYKIKSRSYFKR